MTKRCSRCKESKPFESFGIRYTRQRQRVPGPICKECINEAVKHAKRQQTWERWLKSLRKRTTVNLLSEAELHGNKLDSLLAELRRRNASKKQPDTPRGSATKRT